MDGFGEKSVRRESQRMTCISPGAAEYVTAAADKEKNKGRGSKSSVQSIAAISTYREQIKTVILGNGSLFGSKDSKSQERQKRLFLVVDRGSRRVLGHASQATMGSEIKREAEGKRTKVRPSPLIWQGENWLSAMAETYEQDVAALDSRLGDWEGRVITGC